MLRRETVQARHESTSLTDLSLPARSLAWRMALTAVLICALAFAAKHLIGTAFTEGALFTFDNEHAQWLRRVQTAGLLSVMKLVSALHSTVGILLLDALLAAWLWRREARLWALRVAMILPVELVLNVVVKNVFARARPSFGGVAASLTSYSFPSGHTAGATVFYGLLVGSVFSLTHKAAPRITTLVLAVTMVLAVAASRMYLGAHYASDVTGAVVEGLLWLGGCLAGWSTGAGAARGALRREDMTAGERGMSSSADRP